jgi:hypothetical protein
MQLTRLAPCALALLLAACAPTPEPVYGPRLAVSATSEPTPRRLLVGPGEYRLVGSTGATIDWRICAPRVIRLAGDGRALGGTPFDPIAGWRLEPGVGIELSRPSERRRVSLLLAIPSRVSAPDGSPVGDGASLARLAPSLARVLVDTVEAASGGGIALSVRVVTLGPIVLAARPRGLGPGRDAFDEVAIGDEELPLLLWPHHWERSLDLRSLAYAADGARGPWMSIAIPDEPVDALASLEGDYADRLARRARLPEPVGRLRGFALAGAHELLHVLTGLDGRPDLTDAASAGYRDDDHGPVSWAAWLAFRYAALDPGADLTAFPAPAAASVARDQSCPEHRRADALGLRGE